MTTTKVRCTECGEDFRVTVAAITHPLGHQISQGAINHMHECDPDGDFEW